MCEPSSHNFSVNFGLRFTFIQSSHISHASVNLGSHFTQAPNFFNKKIYFSKKVGAPFNYHIKNCYEMLGLTNYEHEKRRFIFEHLVYTRIDFAFITM